MPELFDITEWQEQSYWNTPGTRNKKIYLNPDNNKLYYFKQSFKRNTRYYKFEFWSEIIASEVGNLLGFNVLPYHIAIHTELNLIGCISESMIDNQMEELIMGGQIIQSFDESFVPENRKTRNKYTFQLIEKALKNEDNFQEYMKFIIEIILFDAIIGNSDRHQENWAFIFSIVDDGKFSMEKLDKNNIWILTIVMLILSVILKSKKKKDINFNEESFMKIKMSPIFDNGCCLGREFDDEQIKKKMEGDDNEINKYIMNGKSEIHWYEKKISHFELVENILASDYRDVATSIFEKVKNNFSLSKIENIVMNIDKLVQNSSFSGYSMSEVRKNFVIKLIDLRYRKLLDIFERYKK